MEFKVLHRSRTTRARIGQLRTLHGTVETPLFMPVGTQGSVKAVSPDDLKDVGVPIILANTYHLYLRPGHHIVRKLGGLHRFMDWHGPILTDSGGFQIYSLKGLRTVSEEGVTFQSHLDGSRHFIGPRQAVQIQQALGADIIMAFDECVPYPSPYKEVEDAVKRTSLWARACREEGGDGSQALFGIVQGGVFKDLRERSARELTDMDFDGYALGGLSVGEERETRQVVISETIGFIPEEKPAYLMGMGTPEDILDAVMLGVDMFDCVLPTRNARNGTFFTSKGRLAIKNACHADDERPVDEECLCYTCRRFSRAYLRHLFLSRELLVYRLNTIHNLHYYARFMEGIRDAIREERLQELRRDHLACQGKEIEGSSKVGLS